MKWLQRGLILYAVMAVLTFGVSASDPAHRACDPRQFNCNHKLDPAMAGFMAGFLWPLYWSWTLADLARGRS